MPYIQQSDRLSLETRTALTPGELNYEFTRIALRYWADHHNYQGINDILGALEGAKLEFYRRHVVPYENTKIIQNGDVTGEEGAV